MLTLEKKISNQLCKNYLKKLTNKKEQDKSKASRRKEIIKLGEEPNELKNGETIENIDKMKAYLKKSVRLMYLQED